MSTTRKKAPKPKKLTKRQQREEAERLAAAALLAQQQKEEEEAAAAAAVKQRVPNVNRVESVLHHSFNRLYASSASSSSSPPPIPIAAKSLIAPDAVMTTVQQNVMSRSMPIKRIRNPQHHRQPTDEKQTPAAAAATAATTTVTKPPRRLTDNLLPYTQMCAEKAAFVRFKQKQNFTHNPRFTKKKSGSAFTAVPAEVLFEDYDDCSGTRTYRAELLLRNDTKLGCRVKVDPMVTTSLFSIETPDYPIASAMIASGMSLRIVVCYRPRSLEDYEDVLTYHTEDGGDFTVRIHAHHRRQCVDMPSTIDFGAVIIGARKRETLVLNNTGASCTANVSIDSSSSSSSYTLSHSYVQLTTNQPVAVQLEFAPRHNSSSSANNDEEKATATTAWLVFHYDNGDVNRVRLTGEGTRVEIHCARQVFGASSTYARSGLVTAPSLVTSSSSSSSKTSTVAAGTEQRILSGGFLSLLDAPAHTPSTLQTLLFPAGYGTQRFVMWNNCAVSIPFRWLNDDMQNFRIEPATGVLAAGGERVEFVCTFAPSSSSTTIAVRELATLAVGMMLLVNSDSEEYRYTNYTSIALLGNQSPPRITVHPKVIQLGVDVPVNVPLQHEIVLRNLGELACTYSFNNTHTTTEEEDDNNDRLSTINATPASGSIEAGDSVRVMVEVTAHTPGQLARTLTCNVEHGACLVNVQVCGSVLTPAVMVSPGALDFGALNFGLQGVCALRTFRVFNPLSNKTQCSYTLRCQESSISFDRSSGALAPGESHDVVATYTPHTDGTISCAIECEVLNGGSKQYVAVSGLAEAPLCTIHPQTVDFEPCFRNVPQTFVVRVKNQRQQRTTVRWRVVSSSGGNDDDDYQVSITPTTLSFDKHADFEVKFVGQRAGPIEVLLVLSVDGLSAPIGCRVRAVVRGNWLSCHDAAAAAAVVTSSAATVVKNTSLPTSRFESNRNDGDGLISTPLVQWQRHTEQYPCTLSLPLVSGGGGGERLWQQYSNAQLLDMAASRWLSCHSAIDFGVTQLHMPAYKRLVIRNHSNKPLPFECRVRLYPAARHNNPRPQELLPTLVQLCSTSANVTMDDQTDAIIRKAIYNSSRALTTSAHERNTTLKSFKGRCILAAQQLREANEEVFDDRSGVLFGVYPPCGVLPPFGMVELVVVSANNVPGDYRDELIVSSTPCGEVDDVPPLTIPLNVHVLASKSLTILPVTPGLSFNKPHSIADAAYPQHTSTPVLRCTPGRSRTLRIFNNCACKVSVRIESTLPGIVDECAKTIAARSVGDIRITTTTTTTNDHALLTIIAANDTETPLVVRVVTQK